MKIKNGFVLQEVAGQTVVVHGDGLDANRLTTLDEMGAFLWRQLEQETDENTLVAALLAEYDVDRKTASTHVKNFVHKLYEHGFFE